MDGQSPGNINARECCLAREPPVARMDLCPRGGVSGHELCCCVRWHGQSRRSCARSRCDYRPTTCCRYRNWVGWHARLGAAALGLFCLATAILFHTNFANRNELLHFEKDLAIAGGMFILMLRGAGGYSVLALAKQREE